MNLSRKAQSVLHICTPALRKTVLWLPHATMKFPVGFARLRRLFISSGSLSCRFCFCSPTDVLVVSVAPSAGRDPGIETNPVLPTVLSPPLVPVHELPTRLKRRNVAPTSPRQAFFSGLVTTRNGKASLTPSTYLNLRVRLLCRLMSHLRSRTTFRRCTFVSRRSRRPQASREEIKEKKKNRKPFSNSS